MKHWKTKLNSFKQTNMLRKQSCIHSAMSAPAPQSIENLAKAGAIIVTKHNNKIPWAKDGRSAYAIRVSAVRAETGQCFGDIQIFTTALDYGKGNGALYGKMVYDAYETFAFDTDNLNHFVIVNVKTSIDQWAAQ